MPCNHRIAHLCKRLPRVNPAELRHSARFMATCAPLRHSTSASAGSYLQRACRVLNARKQRNGRSHRARHLQIVCMARTESQQTSIGTAAPDFKLPDTAYEQREVSLDDVAMGSKALLVLWVCNHCPFVLAIIDGLVAVAKEFQDRGLATVAMSANSVKTHPQDGPEKMAEFAKERGFTFPYLYDETQDTARAYDAVCTPDIYLYDSDRRLQYRGQFDDSRPSNGKPVTGEDLRAAIESVLAGKSVDKQMPSIGCSIKWHPDTSGGREDVSDVPE